MVWAERSGFTQSWASSGWIYAGGEAGARALLGAVASSSIGVAGTVFSITVAALSLASGQMGPRLLRNFNRDPGNQLVLGTFLGTFVYALVLLRTVRSVEEVAFVPHLGVTGALVLALGCVAALVWFVHHVVNSINVNTVIGLVHDELVEAIATLEPGRDAGDPDADVVRAHASAPLRFAGSGYLRRLDEEGLADWAAARDVQLRLHVRPGDYLFPGGFVGKVMGVAPPRPRSPAGPNGRSQPHRDPRRGLRERGLHRASTKRRRRTWSSPCGSSSRWRCGPSHPASTIRSPPWPSWSAWVRHCAPSSAGACPTRYFNATVAPSSCGT